MINQLLVAFLGGVGVLILLILYFRINAFISLLISSITVGVLAGIEPTTIIEVIIKGMGNTLGYVAIIIGLGSIFGAILEHSGATEKLSSFMLQKFGQKNAPTALSLAGFLIAIPVFFDVAFVILVPLLYSLQKKTGQSLLLFAIPLLASLAITHAFIPPTPGPIAVADIINADLGWVILFGLMVGLPTTIVAGLLFGKYIAKKELLKAPITSEVSDKPTAIEPNIFRILCLILLPLFLILTNTLLKALYPESQHQMIELFKFLGHPIIALIISTLAAIYLLGIKYGVPKETLQEISMKALAPAGIIILITGAGGVFKQMLTETGAGVMLAEQFINLNIIPMATGYVLALLVRLLQGSATVAMITAAGIMAPILENIPQDDIQLALMTIAIAAGASGFSHVNDSGFWLVNRYLGQTEIQTVKSWTAMTSILSIVSFSLILIIYGAIILLKG